MSQRRHIAVVAGMTSLLAATPLSSIFATWTWLIYAGVIIAAVVAAAIGVRALRAPVWAQLVTMTAVLVLLLTWLFPSGKEFAGFLPSGATLEHVGALFTQAGKDIKDQAVPVPDRDGLLFIAVLGVGAVAVLIDFLAVGLRQPALAGLPILAIYSVPVAVLPGSASVITFLISATGYLWLLVTDNVDRVRRWGRRFTADGRDVDVWQPSPLGATGIRLGLVGMVFALVIPVALPGITAGLSRFGGTGTGTGPGAGGSGVVNPMAMLSGELNRDREYPMIEVETADPNPYYLRFAVADELTPDEAKPGPAQSDQDLKDSTAALEEATKLPGLGTGYKGDAKITPVNFNMRFLPMYSHPTKVDLTGQWRYDESTGVATARSGVVQGLRAYTVHYVRPKYDLAALRKTRALPATHTIQQRFTKHPTDPKVTALATDITRGKTTVFDKAEAIKKYFEGTGFTYNTKPPEGKSGSKIWDFLTNKSGFCQQYSTAMTWLARAAGIPARVALGFTTRSPEAGRRKLTNYNLHAWVEVYIADAGWVAFDPTPSGSVVGSAPPPWDNSAGNSPGNNPTPGPEVSSSSGTGRELEEKDQGGDLGSPTDTAKPTSRWPLWTGIGVALVVVLLLIPAARRLLLRRARRPRKSRRPIAVATDGPIVLTDDDPVREAARRDAHAAWDELLDLLVDFRVPVKEAETPRMTGERLAARVGPGAADGLSLLATAEERARYALVPLPSDGLTAALHAVRPALAASATRRVRIMAAVLPRSVLLRWRNRIVTSFTNGVDRMGAWRTAALRTVLPRRG